MAFVKGAKRADKEDVGVYSLLTNKYCVLYNDNSERLYSNFESEIGDILPIIHTSIAGMISVGNMIIGNSKGLLVPHNTTDLEMRHLTNGLPDGVQVYRVDEKFNALGNNIVCNDSIAMVNPDIERMTIDIIEDILGVDVIPAKVAGESLIGTYFSMNNNGALAHPRTSIAELDELNSLLQVGVVAGTVNRGKSAIGKGCVVNDFIAFIGKNTTSNEISVVENVFKLSSSYTGSGFSETMRSAIIENLY